MSESLDRYLKEFKEKIKDADDKFAKDIDLYWEQTIKLFDDDKVSFMKTVLRISCVYKKHWGNLYFDKLDIHNNTFDEIVKSLNLPDSLKGDFLIGGSEFKRIFNANVMETLLNGFFKFEPLVKNKYLFWFLYPMNHFHLSGESNPKTINEMYEIFNRYDRLDTTHGERQKIFDVLLELKGDKSKKVNKVLLDYLKVVGVLD